MRRTYGDQEVILQHYNLRLLSSNNAQEKEKSASSYKLFELLILRYLTIAYEISSFFKPTKNFMME